MNSPSDHINTQTNILNWSDNPPLLIPNPEIANKDSHYSLVGVSFPLSLLPNPQSGTIFSMPGASYNSSSLKKQRRSTPSLSPSTTFWMQKKSKICPPGILKEILLFSSLGKLAQLSLKSSSPKEPTGFKFMGPPLSLSLLKMLL
jgi:hypothetical protein